MPGTWPLGSGAAMYSRRVTIETGSRIRLAELVALLSLGTDLGFGQPMEHAIRQALIALRLGELVGTSESERVVIYYSGLLAWVGCHTDAYEQAKWFGDDIRLREDTAFKYDESRKSDMVGFAFRYLGGRDRPLVSRMKTALAFLGQGRQDLEAIATNHYLATDLLAQRLGLGEAVRASLRESYERWDGRGAFQMRGDETTRASRLVNLADVVEVYERTGGVEAARTVARERRGRQFDPEFVDLFCDVAESVFAGLDGANWDAVIAAEPALGRELSDAEFDDAASAIGDFSDLKSPWTIGHSQAVAELAGSAAGVFGLPEEDVARVRRAAWLHDIGRLGVSNSIWDKRGPLSPSERERVRIHPYLTERMLAHSPVLAALGAVAGQHHERLDGSGYPRGLKGDAISIEGRILAAADAYQTMTEMRPHREAKPADQAAELLERGGQAGKFDWPVVRAVLTAAGHVRRQGRQRDAGPAGLTPRELEVLRLLVRGLTNREIAEHLVISKKTVGNHVEHIYAKTGATNRATASLFAMKHGIMTGS